MVTGLIFAGREKSNLSILDFKTGFLYKKVSRYNSRKIYMLF